MNNIEERIDSLKRKNEQKKQELSKIDGQLETVEADLQEKFGSTDVDGLEREVIKLEREVTQEEGEINDQLTKLEKYIEDKYGKEAV